MSELPAGVYNPRETAATHGPVKLSLVINKPPRINGKKLLKQRQKETLKNWKETTK